VSLVIKSASVGYGSNSYTAVGHDDVTKILRPSFVKHKLIAMPSIVDIKKGMFESLNRKGDTITNHSVEMTISITFVDTDDDTKHVVNSYAYAYDNGDKATDRDWETNVIDIVISTE
jgi:hypothetical protein